MKSLVDYLEQHAAAHPERCLCTFLDVDGNETARYAFADFSARTRALAAHLTTGHGLKRGDRVLLAYAPGLDVIVAFLACVRAGIIPVPVAPKNARADDKPLRFIARDCQARALLTTHQSLAAYASLSARSAALNNSEGEALHLDLIATDQPLPAAGAFRDDPGDILFLQYTSGSTSDPKGVVVSHANVVHNATATVDHVPIGVSWLPQYHDMGLIGYYLFPIVLGGATHGFSALDFLRRPSLWLQTISRVRATYSSAPNFGFEYCLREDKLPARELADVDLACLRVLMNAAEPVRAETHRRFFQRFGPLGLRREAHIVAYGLAENTLAATQRGKRTLTIDRRSLQQGTLRVDDGRALNGHALEVASCGAPLDGVALRIVQVDAGIVVDEGTIGEIWIGGESVCHGYWQRAELSREVFGNTLADAPEDDTPYLRTGDIGFLHDGELFVCGRRKDLIIVRGVNYYPHDIESVVESASDQIRPGGVAAFSAADGDELVIVVAEVRSRRRLPDPAEIAMAVRSRCGIVAHTIALVAPRTVAKTTSGKIARQRTRQRWLAGDLPILALHHGAGDDEPTSPADGTLRDRFSYVFDLAPAGRGRLRFDELGIDSLTAVRLLQDVQSLLEAHGASDIAEEVDLDLLQRLTLTAFARLLDRFEVDAARATASWRRVARRANSVQSLRVRTLMRADARFDRRDDALVVVAHEARAETASSVLLTGATGFFGPFLLSSLLKETSCTFEVLIRAADVQHGMDRVRDALRRARLCTPPLLRALERRVRVVVGDLAQPRLGLADGEWQSLSRRVDGVCHNAAMVNYVRGYDTLRPHNVAGTRELVELSFTGRAKAFHYISTTFIFGWTAKRILLESDNNDEMRDLDFGYAQTKWVAEQLVLDAARQGLAARVYRPSLISASTAGAWDAKDIAIRLLAFMINHGLGVDARNQISFLPADIVADNIACIFAQPLGDACTFNITADGYYSMVDVTHAIERRYGYAFTYYDIPGFIAEMNRQCTPNEPLYPLLDFFNRSYRKIGAMQFKRYSSERYKAARAKSAHARADPTLDETVSYLMAYMIEQRMIGAATTDRADPVVSVPLG